MSLSGAHRPRIRTAVLTVSDRAASGEREDLSGPALIAWLSEHSAWTDSARILADERDRIAAQLIEWADSGAHDLILTTGGTGVSPRDRTPEATLSVLDFTIPGLAEAMRAESCKKTPYASLSRAIAGVRKQSLIVNLPGSPEAAIENLAAIWTTVAHAVDKIRGDKSDCAKMT